MKSTKTQPIVTAPPDFWDGAVGTPGARSRKPTYARCSIPAATFNLLSIRMSGLAPLSAPMKRGTTGGLQTGAGQSTIPQRNMSTAWRIPTELKVCGRLLNGDSTASAVIGRRSIAGTMSMNLPFGWMRGNCERDTQDRLDDLFRGMVGKTVSYGELVQEEPFNTR